MSWTSEANPTFVHLGGATVGLGSFTTTLCSSPRIVLLHSRDYSKFSFADANLVFVRTLCSARLGENPDPIYIEGPYMQKDILKSVVAALIFVLVSALFFWPYLEGKRIYQSDLAQYQGMTREISKYELEIGRRPLWTNAIFGGMPTFQIATPNKGNFLGNVNLMFQLGKENPIGFLFTGMIGIYLLLMILKVDYRIAIIGGIAFGLATNNIILYEAGHISKLRAISYLPLLTAGLILAYRGRYWWGFFLFSLGFGLNLLANHIQMTYYFFLTVPLFLGAVFLKALSDRSLPKFLKASGLLLVGFLLAIGSAVSNLWTTYEYSQETIRGNSILTAAGDEFVDSTFNSKRSGLDWDFAMEWSNGPLDLLACIIPGAAGSSTTAKMIKKSQFYEDLAQQGVSASEKLRVPYYWGSLPFTSGPTYFGAIIFFFFILSLFIIKGPLKWWLFGGTVLAVLLSLGKNFQSFNEIVFNYLPLYKKFRTPNSILSVVSFMTTLLGILAVNKILVEVHTKDYWPLIKKIGIRLLGVSLALAILGPHIWSFSSPMDIQYEASGLNLEILVADRKSLFQYDSFRFFVLIAITLGLLYMYSRNRISLSATILGFAVLITLDFWTIDRRFIDYNSFQQTRKSANSFTPRPVDEQIAEDKDPNFRVLDWTINTFNSNSTSYFHNTLGGYHAAKLRRYQDVIDKYLVRGDRNVINMLNTKYIVQLGEDGNPILYTNQEALGNAWAVDSISFVETSNEEIDALDQLDPARTAIVNKEYRDYLFGLDSDSKGTIKLVDYIPDHLTYISTGSNEMLGVFSEVWYGPNKGWMAFIDGKQVEHIRVDYLLRALRIPAGEHRIEFIFQPQSFYTGRIISKISSSLILYGFIWFLGMFLFGEVLDSRARRSNKTSKSSRSLRLKKPFEPKARLSAGIQTIMTDKEVVDLTNEKPPEEQKDPKDNRIFLNQTKFPQYFKILSVTVLVLMLLLSLGSGMNADEEFQTDYSDKLVNFYLTLGKDTSALHIEKGSLHLYGGFFDLTTGMVNHIFGFDQYDKPYHHVRHLFIAFLGFLAIWFASLLAKEIGGWRAGILALLFLFLSPRFLGHSMMNPKDIPFAAGYIMAFYFMVRFFSRIPEIKWIDIAGIILGIGISLGTRAGGLLVIIFFMAFGVIHFLLRYKFKNWNFRNLLMYLKYIGLISLGGYLFAVLFWPAALVDPLLHPFRALSRFTDLEIYIQLLFMGDNVMSNQVSRTYLLVWMWYTVPLFCIGGVIGSVVLFSTFMKRYPPFPLLVVYVSAFFPIAYILIQHSVLHDGWRHLLFTYPSLVILAVLFWIAFENQFRYKKVILFVAYILIGLTCLESGVFIIRNHHYPYVYFNPLAGGIKKAFGNFETDYWGTSVKQAIQWMEDQKILSEEMKDTITIGTSYYYNVSRQIYKTYGQHVKVRYLRYSDRYSEDWDYAIFPSRFVSGMQMRSGYWPPQETIYTVKANGVPLVAILARKGDYIYRGMEAIKNKDWQLSIDLLKSGLVQSPNNEVALRGLAMANMNIGEYPEALEMAKKLVIINGSDPETFILLGLVNQATHDLESAKKAFYQAISLNRSFYPGYYYLALVYREENNNLAAIKNALKSIEINANYAEAYLLIMQIYEEQGELEKANSVRQEYLKLSQTAGQ